MNFISSNLSDEYKNHLKSSGGWNDNCPVAIDRLMLVEFPFQDFAGALKMGELICLDVVSQSVANIFKQLFEANFPIHQATLLDKLNYDDEESMKSNNTSCLNNRLIASTNKLSIHSYGLAIDINPEQNPMISFGNRSNFYTECKIFPSNGKGFLNRMLLKPGMVEPIVEIFFKNGFDIWGGLWQSPIDYHHFEVNRDLAAKLSSCTKDQASALWVNHLQSCA